MVRVRLVRVGEVARLLTFALMLMLLVSLTAFSSTNTASVGGSMDLTGSSPQKDENFYFTLDLLDNPGYRGFAQ